MLGQLSGLDLTEFRRTIMKGSIEASCYILPNCAKISGIDSLIRAMLVQYIR